MPFLIYSLFGLSIFKLLVDAIAGNLLATYSVLLDNILFGLILAIIIRTSIKQKLAGREALIGKIEQLKNQLKKE